MFPSDLPEFEADDIESDVDGSLPDQDLITGSGPNQPPRTFKLIVAYDGTHYAGWQRQPDRPTIQGEIENALASVLGQARCHVRASSRTDAGVHAIGQVVVFRSQTWKANADRLPLALSCFLPRDIVVRSATEVPTSFHLLSDCIGKRYRYRIYSSRIADPLDARFHWWIKRPLDVDNMRIAADYLMGTHDFASLETSGSPRTSTIRTIRAIDIDQQEARDGQQLTIEIEADGFLYNMVRNIVGTLVQVGIGRQNPSWVNDVLASKDRKQAGQTAPPQGLHLLEIYFHEKS